MSWKDVEDNWPKYFLAFLLFSFLAAIAALNVAMLVRAEEVYQQVGERHP